MTDRSPRRRPRPRRTARTADPHELYELSVQDPESDVRIIDRVFRKERGRTPLSVREDFCGTAWFCAEWVKSHPRRTAIGLDLDPEPLRWGRDHHLKKLGEGRRRVTLRRADVLRAGGPKVDVAVAFNFSYCIFVERERLRAYFQSVRRSLVDDGVFLLDIHGGPEAFEETVDETSIDGFTYLWDQRSVDPLTHQTERRIHFHFPDGSRLRDVFRYRWRVWTMPELRDLLQEVGFVRTDIYWEGYDKNGDGNGVYRKVTKVDNDASWIAYIVAWR